MKCHYCRRELNAEILSHDHKVPRVKGGKTELENLIICCRWCNQIKSDRDYKLFKESFEIYLDTFNPKLPENFEEMKELQSKYDRWFNKKWKII